MRSSGARLRPSLQIILSAPEVGELFGTDEIGLFFIPS